jgi:hypothetical protein
VAGTADRLYRIALVTQGRQFRFDVLAPLFSDPARLPLPVLMHLDAVAFRPRDEPASLPASPPPAEAAGDADAPPATTEVTWYRHPENLFHVPLPEGWSVRRGHRGEVQDEAYDTLVDRAGQYRVICWRDSESAEDALATLEAYRDEKLRDLAGQPDVEAAGFSLRGVPMMQLSYPIAQGRIVVRTALVVHGRRAVINVVSPADAEPSSVTRVVSSLFERIHFPSRVAEPTSVSDTDAAPAVPSGWVATVAGNVTVHVPPEWTTAEFAADDEGLWFQGGDMLLPEVSFRLVRDTPVEQFLGDSQPTDRKGTQVGRLPADEITFDTITLAGRQDRCLLVVVRRPVAGGTIALAACAPAARWAEYDALFRQIIACVEIDVPGGDRE